MDGLALILKLLLEPNMFGQIDVAADYHLTPFHEKLRGISALW